MRSEATETSLKKITYLTVRTRTRLAPLRITSGKNSRVTHACWFARDVPTTSSSQELFPDTSEEQRARPRLRLLAMKSELAVSSVPLLERSSDN